MYDLNCPFTNKFLPCVNISSVTNLSETVIGIISAFPLNLAISKLNGVIIENGAEFSFNNTIGPMNEGNGFKKATGFDSNGKKIKIKDIMREAYYVPETKPIDEVFKELQKNKMQMAIVVDEYGGTSGLLTMEDILEELVGNIFDEYDDVEVEFNKIDENTYMVEGSIPLYELKRILSVEIPEGDYDTLSGYLIEKLGRIPDENEKPTIEDKKLTYKIEELEDKRIKWVKVCKNQEVTEDNEDYEEQEKNNEE